MKQAILFLLFFIFLLQYYSCEDSIVPNTNGAVTITSLKGTVSNLEDFLRNVKAFVFAQNNSALIDTQRIGSDTLLNINLAQSPGTCLEKVGYFYNNAVVSDTNGMVNNIWLEMFDDLGNFYGLLSKDNRTGENYHEEPGFFVTNAVYSDRYLVITGADTNVFNGVTTISKYGMILGHGWNLVTKKVNAITKFYAEYEYISGEPSGGKWRFDYAGLDNPAFLQKKSLSRNFKER